MFIIQIFLHKTNIFFFSLAYTRTLMARLLTTANSKEKEKIPYCCCCYLWDTDSHTELLICAVLSITAYNEMSC